MVERVSTFINHVCQCLEGRRLESEVKICMWRQLIPVGSFLALAVSSLIDGILEPIFPHENVNIDNSIAVTLENNTFHILKNISTYFISFYFMMNYMVRLNFGSLADTLYKRENSLVFINRKLTLLKKELKKRSDCSYKILWFVIFMSIVAISTYFFYYLPKIKKLIDRLDFEKNVLQKIYEECKRSLKSEGSYAITKVCEFYEQKRALYLSQVKGAKFFHLTRGLYLWFGIPLVGCAGIGIFEILVHALVEWIRKCYLSLCVNFIKNIISGAEVVLSAHFDQFIFLKINSDGDRNSIILVEEAIAQLGLVIHARDGNEIIVGMPKLLGLLHCIEIRVILVERIRMRLECQLRAIEEIYILNQCMRGVKQLVWEYEMHRTLDKRVTFIYKLFFGKISHAAQQNLFAIYTAYFPRIRLYPDCLQLASEDCRAITLTECRHIRETMLGVFAPLELTLEQPIMQPGSVKRTKLKKRSMKNEEKILEVSPRQKLQLTWNLNGRIICYDSDTSIYTRIVRSVVNSHNGAYYYFMLSEALRYKRDNSQLHPEVHRLISLFYELQCVSAHNQRGFKRCANEKNVGERGSLAIFKMKDPGHRFRIYGEPVAWAMENSSILVEFNRIFKKR